MQGQAEGPHTRTTCLHMCKHPQGCNGTVCPTRSACVKVYVHTYECASMCECAHPCQPQQQQTHRHISMFPHAGAGARATVCTFAQVCTHVCKPLLPREPAPTGPSAAPSICTTLWGTEVHTAGSIHTMHMCVHRRLVTHLAAVGIAPPGPGLPRCSCWVTARPNDAMSSFAYGKQHLCCRVAREEALPPAPRDPQTGCPAMLTHPPCTYTPLCSVSMPHVSMGLLH